MAGLIALLRDLHRAHRLVRDLREHLDRLPIQLKAQRTKLTRHETALREAQDAIKLLKVAMHTKEVTLKTKSEQIDKYEQQMNGATSKKEYDAFKTEIGHTKQACGQLEDEILQAMGEMDERMAALPALEKALQEAKEELARFEAQAKEKQGSVGADLAQAQASLREIETRIPAEVRPQYDRVVHAMGADALAPAQGRICSSCMTEMTAQNQTNLKLDRFVLCASCGRMLYLSE